MLMTSKAYIYELADQIGYEQSSINYMSSCPGNSQNSITICDRIMLIGVRLQSRFFRFVSVNMS